MSVEHSPPQCSMGCICAVTDCDYLSYTDLQWCSEGGGLTTDGKKVEVAGGEERVRGGGMIERAIKERQTERVEQISEAH